MTATNRLIRLVTALAALAASAGAPAALTVTPSTWNVIGLDSNSPALGPRHFPVGAQLCSTTTATNVTASFNWTTSNPNVNLRPGSPSLITIPSIPAGECREAMFEVEVTPSAASFDTTRGYYISAGGGSTPTPRELYVERLISQNRNAVSDIQLGGTSIPLGGSMNLVVGSTYNISVIGKTATQGYEQLEAFMNLPSTIFRINAVRTTFSADTSPNIYSPNYPFLYLDGCSWENDPYSPNYRACWATGKGGGNVRVDYNVTILGGGGTSQVVNSLLYDFSGSSYHYNSDYSLAGVTINIIDPTAATIAKSFQPGTVAPNAVTTLSITLGNPTADAIAGASVADFFPSGMTVASPLSYSTTCSGTYSITDAAGGSLAAGDTGIKIAGATIPANSSCTLNVAVAAASNGSYTNTTNNLFVNGTLDTGKTASATLTVDSGSFPPPVPPACPSPVTLATWNFSGTYSSSYAADSKHASITGATASSSGTTGSFSSARWLGTDGWKATGTATDASPPYLELSLDTTTRYSSVRISYDHLVSPTNAWASTPSNNQIRTYYSVDGGSFTGSSETASRGSSLGALTAVTPVTASTVTTGNIKFRILADGAVSGTTDTLEIDNVVITGCAVPSPPSLAKAFSPSTIAAGATSTLTFTLSNPNASSSLTGVKFSDVLPDGMVVAATPAASTTCGGSPTWSPAAGSSTLNFGQITGATLAASSSCTVSVSVTVASDGIYNNISNPVSAVESGTNNTTSGSASASLTAVAPPSISKIFGTDPIPSGGTSTLLFSIVNPNSNYALTGVAFADALPAGMTIAALPEATTSSCGSPVFSPVAGSSSLSFSGGSIAAGGTCLASVKITASTGVTGTTYTNTTGNVSHLINSATVNGNTASDTLTVNPLTPSIALLKQVATSSSGPWKSYEAVPVGSSVYFRFLVENTGDAALSSVSVSDPASYLNMANCTWKDGDNATLTAPFTLPVAGAGDGHYATCVLGPVTAAEGSWTNTATAQGSYLTTSVSDTSSASYATIGLSIDKSSAQASFSLEGQALNYSYAVSNTGSATLGSLSVVDDKIASVTCPSLTTQGDLDNFLDPGESITCTASYTVSASDVSAGTLTNQAYAMTLNPSATSNTDSVTLVLEAPNSLTFQKTVQVLSDPINGTTNPKAIPGAIMEYALTVTNAGAIPIDADSLYLSDRVPAHMKMKVCSDPPACTNVTAPVAFSCSTTPACGLTYTHSSDIRYSNNPAGAAPYSYTPVPDAEGYDSAVTGFQLNPKGSMSAATPPNNAVSSFKVRMQIQ